MANQTITTYKGNFDFFLKEREIRLQQQYDHDGMHMMIDIASAIPTILAKLKKIPVDHYLDLQTFKKDRSITIIRQTEDEFQIIERGFHDDMFSVKVSKLKKALKTLLKREFPRSNKVRLYSGTSNSIKQLPLPKK